MQTSCSGDNNQRVCANSCICHLILWCEPHTRLNSISLIAKPMSSINMTLTYKYCSFASNKPFVSSFTQIWIFIIKLMSTFANSLDVWSTLHCIMYSRVCTHCHTFATIYHYLPNKSYHITYSYSVWIIANSIRIRQLSHILAHLYKFISHVFSLNS